MLNRFDFVISEPFTGFYRSSSTTYSLRTENPSEALKIAIALTEQDIGFSLSSMTDHLARFEDEQRAKRVQQPPTCNGRRFLQVAKPATVQPEDLEGYWEGFWKGIEVATKDLKPVTETVNPTHLAASCQNQDRHPATNFAIQAQSAERQCGTVNGDSATLAAQLEDARRKQFEQDWSTAVASCQPDLVDYGCHPTVESCKTRVGDCPMPALRPESDTCGICMKKFEDVLCCPACLRD